MEGVRAKLRSGDGENYRTLRVLPANTEVDIVEENKEGSEFTKIKTADGQYGWMKSSLLQPISTQEQAVSALVPTQPVSDKKTGTPVSEATQKELIAMREQLAKMQTELEKERARANGEPRFSVLLLSALGAFAMGVAIGAFLLHIYYIRRLHGLRL